MLKGSLALVPVKEKEQFSNESEGRDKMEFEDGSRTVDCLRGRLLAERVASKQANEEAELMARRVIELEMQLKIETQSRKRAEKKLKFATKKLNSLNISAFSGRFGSSEKANFVGNSSTYFSNPQELEEQKSNSQTGETNLDLIVSENLSHHNSTILNADSVHEEPINEEERLSSRGSDNSYNYENSSEEEEGSNTSIALGELDSENFRQSSPGEKETRRQGQIKHVENRLSLVPVTIWPDPTHIDDRINDVLVALKHAKEHLRGSIGRRDIIFSQPFQLYGM